MRTNIPTIRARYSIFEALGVPEDTREIRCLHPEKHSNGDAHPSATINDGRTYCHVCKSGEDAIGVYALRNGMDYAHAVAELETRLGLVSEEPREVAAYRYLRHDGSLAYEAVRFEPGWDGKRKGFKQRRIIDGETVWGLGAGNYKRLRDGSWYLPKKGNPPGDRPLPATERVLYRLPELLAGKDALVLIPEGEKDVENLIALNASWVATCNSEGAGKWRASFGKLLTGRRVAVLQDNDEAGRRHAADVAASISGNVKIVAIPGLPEKGDVTDWILARRAAGLADPEIAAELQALIDAAPAYATTEPPAASSPLPPPLTELGIRDRFVTRHGDEIRYCHALRQWFRWDGLRWRPDGTRAVIDLAAAIVREEVLKASDEPAELGSAKKLETAAKIKGSLELAGAAQGSIAMSPDAMDANPWLLTCRNGVLDLRTGKLAEPRKDTLLTRLVPYRFVPDAPAPRWERFLSEIMEGDQERIDFLRHFAGYCLTAETREHVLLMLVGVGGNGKSVLVETWMRILGKDFASEAPPGLLLMTRNERHPTELMSLKDRRLVISSEVPAASTFSEERLKSLTGGDTITARAMRQDFVSFRPTHKLVIACNHQPQVKDASEGFWRRVRVVPFNGKFTPDTDPSLPATLEAESEGILAWMVRGCVEWQRAGLGHAAAVDRTTSEYRSREDVVGRWEADRIARGEAMADVAASALWSDFERWCKDEGEPLCTQTAFGRDLTRRGWTRDRTVNGIVRTHPKALLGGLNG